MIVERLLSPLVLGLLAVLPIADDALVAEFRHYYGGRDRTPPQRREAVLTLEGVDSAGAVEALVEALEDDDFLVRRAAVSVMSDFRSDAAVEAMVEGVLLDKKLARNELIMAGAAEAAGGMQDERALEPLLALASHKDVGVRLGALAGLGHLGRSEAVPVLAEAVGDSDTAVAIAGLRALGEIGDAEAARDALLTGLTHTDKSVRLAGIGAAVAMRSKDAVRPLIVMMGDDPDARVAEDAYEAVQQLTLRDLGDDPAPWLAWWDRNEETFELPDLEKVLAAREKLAREGSKYRAAKSFSTIETKSEFILFVIDVSQSMEEPFGDLERLARSGRTYSSTRRIDIVKEELSLTIQELPDTTSFNIIAYASDVDLWKKKLQRANILNKNNAVDWVDSLEPKGGQAGSFRSRMGLTANATNEGLTNTHLALMTAFGEEVGEKAGSAFVTQSKEPVDTIFFLTDGEPTVGETVDMTEVREEVQRVNAYRGVQIHVIYVGAYGGKEFRYLAEENDGVFVSIGG